MTAQASGLLGDVFRATATEIERVDSIVLACHVNPDGDALGSMLGLAHGLRILGKEITVLSQDGVPDIYTFLPGCDAVQSRLPETVSFPLAIVLDSGDISRIGPDVLTIINRSDKIIDVDHHISGDGFGDIRVIDSTAASTAEIVFEFLKFLNVDIAEPIATCLFTGLITDTGSFRFQNTTGKTFRTGAELVDAGAKPSEIAEIVFDNRTLPATLVLGRALTSLQSAANGRVIWVKLTHADFVATGARDEDTEGIVNYARGVRGAEVGVFFREAVPGKIRISLRSHEGLDVSKVAGQYNGGGHRMASGCSFTGTLEDAERAVIQTILSQLI
jgi:phosphoesterase RecJ-like protein